MRRPGERSWQTIGNSEYWKRFVAKDTEVGSVANSVPETVCRELKKRWRLGGRFGGELFAGGDFFPGWATSGVITGVGGGGVSLGKWPAGVMAWLWIRLFFLTDS